MNREAVTMTFTAYFVSVEEPRLVEMANRIATFERGTMLTIHADNLAAATELAYLNAPAGHRLELIEPKTEQSGWGGEQRTSDDRCEWAHDPAWESDVWLTACGQAHVFEVAGPTDNDYRFCPYCGEAIEVKETADE